MNEGRSQDATLVLPRIDIHTFVAGIWAFYAIALLTVSVRTIIRIRIYKQLQVDDYLLLFASVCLTVATIFVYWRHTVIYDIQMMALNPTSAQSLANVSMLPSLTREGNLQNFVFLPLTWTAIFAAKFSYLWFLGRLVHRIKALSIYRWFVCSITVCTYILCMITGFAICPWTDLRALTCSYGSRFKLGLHMTTAATSLDIITDFLIVSLSVCILWKVKLRMSQKLALAVFLCMSIVMAAIGIVRVSGLSSTTKTGSVIYDSPWQEFWLQVEACLAVCLVSSTAFRQFFVAQEQRRQARAYQSKWYSSMAEKISGSRITYETYEPRLPPVPPTTPISLLDFVKAKRISRSSTEGDLIAESSKECATANRNWMVSPIMVTKTYETHFEEMT